MHSRIFYLLTEKQIKTFDEEDFKLSEDCFFTEDNERRFNFDYIDTENKKAELKEDIDYFLDDARLNIDKDNSGIFFTINKKEVLKRFEKSKRNIKEYLDELTEPDIFLKYNIIMQGNLDSPVKIAIHDDYGYLDIIDLNNFIYENYKKDSKYYVMQSIDYHF